MAYTVLGTAVFAGNQYLPQKSVEIGRCRPHQLHNAKLIVVNKLKENSPLLVEDLFNLLQSSGNEQSGVRSISKVKFSTVLDDRIAKFFMTAEILKISFYYLTNVKSPKLIKPKSTKSLRNHVLVHVHEKNGYKCSMLFARGVYNFTC